MTLSFHRFTPEIWLKSTTEINFHIIYSPLINNCICTRQRRGHSQLAVVALHQQRPRMVRCPTITAERRQNGSPIVQLSYRAQQAACS
jgi:hypothetical protein